MQDQVWGRRPGCVPQVQTGQGCSCRLKRAVAPGCRRVPSPERWQRNVLPSVLKSLLLVWSCAAWSSAAVVADQALRYVNNEVLTMGDVATRNQMRIAEYTRRGIPVPQTRGELITFSKETLEDLTDESLLVQEAKDMGAEPDREEIIHEVLDAAKAAGSALTLRDRTDQVRLVMRTRTVERILGFYENVNPAPSPVELERMYAARSGEFMRPPRVRVLQILQRPSPPEARADVRTARTALMRAAQGAPDPRVQAVVKTHLEAFLAAGDAAGQDAALGALTGALAILPLEELDSLSAEPVTRAQELERRQAELRDAASVSALLAAQRMALAARWGNDREAAFRAAAVRLSQGANATSGGQLGWIEPGTYNRAFDDVIFNLAPGAVSEVFATGDALCVVMVAERLDAKPRPYAEVAGELDMRERRIRREQTRAKVVAILRHKASVRDVITLERLGR